MIIDSPIISGSSAASGSLNQFGNVAITGSLTVTGAITGAVTGSVDSASYASNAELLDGRDSTTFTSTSSFQNYTSSNDAQVLQLNNVSASLNSYTSSNNANIAALNAATASLYNATSSIYLATASIYLATASLNLATASIYGATSSLFTYTSSNNDSIADIRNATASLYNATASIYGATSSLFNYSASSNLRIGSLEQYTASLNTRSASFACIDSTNNFACAQYFSNASNAISFTSTGSLYSDGGVRVTKDMYVSGTAYFNNVTVFGTQSINYITSSQLNIASNLITVNTSTPAVRFGGLAVYDSGSLGTGLTGSLLWDSENNHWVYSNPSGSSYSGGMFISGPRSAALGSEQGTTACALMMGQGGDHITSSAIFHYSNATCFYGNTVISSSGAACFGNVICAPQSRILGTGDLSYIYNSGASTTDANFYIYNSTTDILMARNSGCVGIGTSNPLAPLHIGQNGVAAQLWLQRTDGYNPVKLVGGTLSDGNGFKITMNTTDVFGITSAGDVQIGYSGTPASVGKLFISRGDQYGLTINSFSGGTCITSTDDNIFFNFGVNNTLKMFCDYSNCFRGTVCAPSFIGGTVTATATANTYAGGALILKASGGTNPIYLTSVGGLFALSNGGSADHLLISSTGATTLCAAHTGYGLSVTNVLDDSQGLLVRATDNDPSLFIFNAQSSNAATCTGFVSRMAVTKQGRVGIANETPNNLLEVGNNTCCYPSVIVRSQAGYLPSVMLTRGDGLFCNNSNSNYVIANSDNGFEISRVDSLNTSTFNRCQLIQVNCTGNVGINTINPAQKLHVIGNVVVGCTSVNSGIYGCYLYFPFASQNLANGTARAYIQFDSIVDSSVNTNDTWKWKMVAVARCGNQGCYNSSLEFLRTTRGGVTDETVLGLNGYTGYVGIGTCTPSYKLDVKGYTFSAGYVLNPELGIETVAGSPYAGMFAGVSSFPGGYGSVIISSRPDLATPIVFATSNGSVSTERIRIAGTGVTCFSNTICAPIGIFSTCVGINVTSPDAPLRIHGGAGSTSTVIIAGGAVGNDNATISAPYSMVFQVDNTGGVGGRSFSFKCGGKGYSDGTTLLAISSTGNVTPGANGTQDLGSSSLRWCTVYTSDLSLNNGIGNYTIVEGENDLFLYNNNSCKVFKFLLQEVCPEIAPKKLSI